MILNFIVNLLFMAFAIFVIIYGTEIANQLLQFGQRSAAIRIPMGYVYMATPIGMGLTLIRLVQNQVSIVRSLVHKEVK